MQTESNHDPCATKMSFPRAQKRIALALWVEGKKKKKNKRLKEGKRGERRQRCGE